MPFGSIQVQPGVNSVATPTLNQQGIATSNLIRFRLGLIEKLGGWLRYLNTTMGSITRALHAWTDLTGNSWLGAGNLSSLLVINNGAITTITPQTLVSSTAPNFTTVSGSQTISVVDPNISTLSGLGGVFFNTPITVGGITLTAGFAFNGTPTGDSYTITALAPATSTVNNSGAVPSFTTTSGSSTVTVTFANHGLSTGAKFAFPISTLVGGVTISGLYENIQVTGTNTFTIVASSQATSAATVSMNSGNAQFLYNLAVGPASVTSFGALGPIGQYAIGQGYSQVQTAGVQTGTPITATDWTLDNWGEILLACPRGGAIWYWQPGSGFTTAAPIATGPFINNGIFVAMPAQILVAWGSTSSIDSGNTDAAQDTLIVRWSDQLNFFTWQPLATNQAGSFHIPTGSTIRGGIQGSGIALIFTDIDVWAMTYIGYPLVFGFNKIFSSGGLLGPHAVCEMYGAIYWMGNDNFYTCVSGAVNIIPCPIWDNVFQNLDTTNSSKAVAAAHPDFNEVWFSFPVVGGTGENSMTVKVNVSQGFIWDPSIVGRSAWQTRSVLGPPIGADPATTLLQQHETSYSADGSAMNSYYTTGFGPIGDGENFVFIDQVQPDAKYTTYNSSTPSANIGITVNTVNYPNDGTTQSQTVTVTSTTEYADLRVRGRQAQWTIGTNDTTSWWRIGNFRYRFGVDGRR